MKTKVTVKTKRPPNVPSSVTIRVGILDGDKRYAPEMDPVLAAFSDSMSAETVGEVAERHEFGMGVPQRSWLREWFDSKGADVQKMATERFQAAMAAGADVGTVVGQIAFVAEASIKDRIQVDKPFLPLAPATIEARKAKGRDNPPYTPLVDTGAMLSAIAADSEVRP